MILYAYLGGALEWPNTKVISFSEFGFSVAE